MKIYHLIFIGFLSLMAFSQKKSTALSGTVTDAETGDALIGAVIQILQDEKNIAHAMTDVDGHYKIDLAPGKYTATCSYTGYVVEKNSTLTVLPEQENVLHFKMNPSKESLSEVVVTAYGVEKRSKKTKAVKTAPMKDKATETPIKYKAEAPAPAALSIDGVRVTGERKPSAKTEIPVMKYEEAPAIEKIVTMDSKPAVFVHDLNPDIRYEAKEDDLEKSLSAAPPPGTSAPKAGLLTAGEWNDLQHWGEHWTDLLTDGEIDTYQEMYKFYPKYRYSVILRNDNDFPLVDAPVFLKDEKGQTLWQSRTDNTGRAELWAGMFDPKKPENLHLEALVNDKIQQLGKANPIEQGINFYNVNFECASPKNADIVWAVDATGSMGDEIEYLKTELLDVIGRVKTSNPDLTVRMGSVFYRDKGDEYVTRKSPLTNNIESTVGFIRKQSAGGGGDFPEAVHSALEEAIGQMEWSNKAVARICFLVLDASPHKNAEVVESLHRSIRLAAEKGIHIIPLSASGIQKDTEFLMKFFGLATNGTYLFLTDHSGIGGKHLEPTTEEYKVEMLNDLLVRIISENVAVKSCGGKSSIRFSEDPQQQGAKPWAAFFYPNPASDQFKIDLPVDVQSIAIYNAEGKLVRRLENIATGTTTVNVSDLQEGFYVVRILKDNQEQSGKLMVLRAR